MNRLDWLERGTTIGAATAVLLVGACSRPIAQAGNAATSSHNAVTTSIPTAPTTINTRSSTVVVGTGSSPPLQPSTTTGSMSLADACASPTSKTVQLYPPPVVGSDAHELRVPTVFFARSDPPSGVLCRYDDFGHLVGATEPESSPIAYLALSSEAGAPLCWGAVGPSVARLTMTYPNPDFGTSNLTLVNIASGWKVFAEANGLSGHGGATAHAYDSTGKLLGSRTIHQ